jgi:hypothetical protein
MLATSLSAKSFVLEATVSCFLGRPAGDLWTRAGICCDEQTTEQASGCAQITLIVPDLATWNKEYVSRNRLWLAGTGLYALHLRPVWSFLMAAFFHFQKSRFQKSHFQIPMRFRDPKCASVSK